MPKPKNPKTHKRPKPLYAVPLPPPPDDLLLPRAHPLGTAPFILHEDGSVTAPAERPSHPAPELPAPVLKFKSESPFIRLYHGNCLQLLDAIADKYPEGRFDAIFADPPYFLSNGGITCHAGKMVKVDKGDWDKSRGPEVNHEFNLEWLRRCQRVLKPNGTIWVSGTHHVIFSIGYAMQQLGYKILNDIAWEKPNPPPNLSCRYFTHSTETILWAAKSEKSKHVFNYQEMRKVTGKQMKTVWREESFHGGAGRSAPADPLDINERRAQSDAPHLDAIWTMTALGGDEKKIRQTPHAKASCADRALPARFHQPRRHGARPVPWRRHDCRRVRPP